MLIVLGFYFIPLIICLIGYFALVHDEHNIENEFLAFSFIPVWNFVIAVIGIIFILRFVISVIIFILATFNALLGYKPKRK